MKFATFDIELANSLPDGKNVWEIEEPLGISCAAIALSESNEIITFEGYPRLTSEECKNIVRKLNSLKAEGYEIVTWNGCAFDFAVLAKESGLVDECAELAYNHIDLMLIVTFIKGYYLSLDKALSGAGLSGKIKTVRLKDGSIIDGISGVMAPKLWQQGEREAVLTYLKEDVVQLLQLVQVVYNTKTIKWLSNTGKPMSVSIEKLYLVKECFDLPLPDNSWMTNPPNRDDFIAWIPKKIIEESAPKKSKIEKIGEYLIIIVAFFLAALAKSHPFKEIFLLIIWPIVVVYLIFYFLVNKLKPSSSKWFKNYVALQSLSLIWFIVAYFILKSQDIEVETYLILFNLIAIPLLIFFYFENKIFSASMNLIYQVIFLIIGLRGIFENLDLIYSDNWSTTIGLILGGFVRIILIIMLTMHIILFRKKTRILNHYNI